MSRASSSTPIDPRVITLLGEVVHELRALRSICESRLADLGAPSNGSSVNTTSTPGADDQLLTATQLGELLQIAPRTLQRHRHLKQLPPSIKVGGALRWRRRDVDRFLDRRVK